MGIVVEPQVFTIRGGEDYEKVGAPYDFVITAMKTGKYSIRFIGMVRKDGKKEFSINDYRAIKKYFLAMGINYAEWERVGSDVLHSYTKKHQEQE